MLETDYYNYSIVYSCTGVAANMISLEYMWVLTRKTYLPGSPDYIQM